MSGARILVADDDEVLRRLVTHVLTREGYQVVAAGNGEEVLQHVMARRPDAIILDAMMPGIDGLEVLHALRQGETTKDIPVIMLSARSQERDVVRGFDFGANDYLGKPFKPGELLVRLKRLIGADSTPDRDGAAGRFPRGLFSLACAPPHPPPGRPLRRRRPVPFSTPPAPRAGRRTLPAPRLPLCAHSPSAPATPRL